ncbi:PA14 domain-containing protein [Streptomyces sp. NPDC014864]|uniref:PA14 domain-containing protein n=1 Tax=Streptomyces sp. NPDC014864 TaxID=3364924 RepID=UPI0036FE292B
MNPARRTTAAALVLTTAAGALSVAAVPASAAVSCASPVYKRQFYANTTFSGTPKKTDCDSAIDQNWGTGAPASGLPSNYFAVRWTVTRDFGSGGPFALAASAQDGIRVYLDGVRKIDLWKNVSSTVRKTVNVTVPSGKHTLRVDFVNWTGTANAAFTYKPRTSADVDKVRPLTPTAPFLTYDPATGRAVFTWSRNVEMDLAGYRVYRRLKGTSYGSKPLATTTSTSYTDTTLPKTGATYYYEVRAVDRAGNESGGTADQGATTVDTTAPVPPGGVGDNWAIGDVTKVTLYWDSSPDADVAGYRVYRSRQQTVAPTAANLVSGTGLVHQGFTDNPPQTGDFYYYVVTAVDTHGNESAVSGTAVYSTNDWTPPSFVPDDFEAVDGEHEVTLTWSWQQDPESPLNGFEVYRDGARLGVSYGSFVDRDVARSSTHTYWVRAIDDAGNVGPASEKITVDHVGDFTAPGVVTGLTATPVENGVRLDWDDSTADDIDHYEIHRGVYADGSWTYTDITGILPYGTVWSDNRDPNLPDGERLRYAVIAVDRDGNALDVASATTVDVTELDLRPDETYPEDVGVLSVRDAWGELRVSYDAEHDTHGTATGFHVDRWDHTGGRWVRLTDTPVTGTDRYTDTTAPAGSTVYYRVTLAYPDGTESAPAGTHMST